MDKLSKPLFDEKPTLFGDEASPPVRFVMMTASALNVEYKLHRVDLFCSEHKSEFYTRINPLQKVPALAVGEHIISDSHAIALYLCRRSRDNKLYSKSTKIKSQIDQMLFFNSGTLFPIDSAIFSEYFTGKWPADENKVKDWYRALDYLEHRLKEHNWLAGDRVSICDLCCVTTVSSLQLLLPLSDRHSNISDWLQRLQKLPFYKLNERGLKRLNVFVEKIKSIL
ncbi:glutathione S-transferase 1-like isoform X2 [Plodia interpunctella]|uniref:glutathione S-transferase 1-like isoform X2 n=1 Tax=Plodia interpunctella TaxID=58824 RepID=UPI0023689B5B|nr:glutathione S-transferase 1-like isoform X2 [Plodia interpunctella]